MQHDDDYSVEQTDEDRARIKRKVAEWDREYKVMVGRRKNFRDKARGMLVGLAVGDALGSHYEFGCTSEDITRAKAQVREMHRSVQFQRGVWTDDTSMALCLADSLLECGGYDSFDVMAKYLKWRDEGYRSCFPMGYGIGLQTDHALTRFEKGNPIVGKTEPREWTAGNGAVMRMAPVVIATANPNKNLSEHEIHYTKDAVGSESVSPEDIADILELARVSARETHYSIVAEAGAEMLAAMLYGAMRGLSKSDIVACTERWLSSEEYVQVYQKEIEANGSLSCVRDKSGNGLKDLGGYVMDAIAIARWGLTWYDSFEDGMVAVICLGGDTDTNAAIYGQLAGAYYGYESIPKRWTKDLCLHGEIVKIADELLAMEECLILCTRFEEDKQKKSAS